MRARGREWILVQKTAFSTLTPLEAVAEETTRCATTVLTYRYRHVNGIRAKCWWPSGGSLPTVSSLTKHETWAKVGYGMVLIPRAMTDQDSIFPVS